MSSERIGKIFGNVGRVYVPLVESFEQQLPSIAYKVDSSNEADAIETYRNTPQGCRDLNQLIWTDQIHKAHFAAVTAILRNARWIRGMTESYDVPNVMVFGTCFRSLLEASADTFYSLKDVPWHIADNFHIIRTCLQGDADDYEYFSLDLERALDHHIHARKRQTRGPSHLKPRSTRDYIKILQGSDQGKIVDAYKILCEIAHPAALSVLAFLDSDARNGLQHLDTHPDKRLINMLIADFQSIMPQLFQHSLNLAFQILDVVNHLPIPELSLPCISTLSFDESPDWTKARAIFART